MNNSVKEAQDIILLEKIPSTVGEAERTASYYGSNGCGVTMVQERRRRKATQEFLTV